MESVLAVMRPKATSTITHEFCPSSYEILLMDVKLSGELKSKPIQELPKTTISFEEEPADHLFRYLYNFTGGEFGGIKGKRAVFIPPARTEKIMDTDSSARSTLYCLPIDCDDELNTAFVKNLPTSPKFHSLDNVLDTMNISYSFSRQTKVMLNRLDSWMKQKHNVPGAIDLLLSSNAEERLKRSTTNPAYFVGTSVTRSMVLTDSFTKSVANEALARMMSIEKCDKTIINPLFGSDLAYKAKVDAFAVNIFWGVGKPDYSKVTANGSKSKYRNTEDEDLPLIKAVKEGDVKRLKSLIEVGHSVEESGADKWTAIHFAAWYGYLDCLEALLTEGECSPNLTNADGRTPLHLAAKKGKVYVTELLLDDKNIDVFVQDKNGKTPLNLCEDIDETDWQDVATLLRNAMAPKIKVHLMDGNYRNLTLRSGTKTTVQQLHEQMVKELKLPRECGHLFTLWLCSRNLQLQLKHTHKPIQHMNDWKRVIVEKLTDQNPDREDPQLYWRRDAILNIEEEKKVTSPEAINLLFHEAYHNYIKSLYPCADQDAIMLGGILMQLHLGDFDAKKAKSHLANEKSLMSLVPKSKLKNRSVKWAEKIYAQYKHYSNSMANRDRAPKVLQEHCLSICRNLTVYGCAFFTGFVQIKTTKSQTGVYIGVNDLGIHVINCQTKNMLQSFSYKDIEWSQRDNQPLLDIRPKGSNKRGMCVHTKQAGLINHLTTKLSSMYQHL